MGYRNYIGYIPKEKYELIRTFNYSEFFAYYNQDIDNDGYVSLSDIPINLYELGKYFDIKEDYFKDFSLNNDVQKYLNDESEFFVVGKDFLKLIIENYRETIKNNYTNLLKDCDYNDISPEKSKKLFNHIREFSFEWLNFETYDLENGDEITTSWKYEYAIFELVRIYKHFDWKNNVMIYYGY